MTESPQDLMEKAAQLRDRSLTSEQQGLRRLNTLRAEAIQRGVGRGLNAPASGIFGGVKKTP